MLCLPNFRKHRKTTKRKKKDRDRWPDTFSKRVDWIYVSFSYHVGVCPWRTFLWAETKKGKNGLFLASLCSCYSEILPRICSAFFNLWSLYMLLSLPAWKVLPSPSQSSAAYFLLILMMTGLLLGSPPRCTQIWFRGLTVMFWLRASRCPSAHHVML